MLQVIFGAWPLLLGMLLLMVGNGMQGTLLGIRGDIEGFPTWQMSLVISAYFVGFLFSSRMTPALIRRVGHVRVFAALGSMISAALILFPVVAEPVAWIALRVLLGFCFSGVYITAESWLNNSATNETRGKALSLYMIVQMGGVVAAQGLVSLGDPSGFILFIVPSVLVSIAFAPILLSINPTPPFESTKPMSLSQLVGISPLGCVGMFALGIVFSGMFGMAAVYGTLRGLTVSEISAFVAALYLGALLFQYPIGWLSDRMDRRQLAMVIAFLSALVGLLAAIFAGAFAALLVLAFFFGGLANPLYPLLIAYTNDMLDLDDMAAASGGLLFINGVGAIVGPLLIGSAMVAIGPSGFWIVFAAVLALLGAFAVLRMLSRPETPGGEETYTYAPIMPSASPVVVEAAQEVYAEEILGDNTTEAEQMDEES